MVARPDVGGGGAAGLYSTTDDLSTFVAASLAIKRSHLGPAFALMLKARRPGSRRGEQEGLGWAVMSDDHPEVYYRDGGSFGFSSVMAADPGRGSGSRSSPTR